jgi:hypothetical protein
VEKEAGRSGFVLDNMEYCVGPYGASDAVTGMPCVAIDVIGIWVAVAIWDAT